MRRSLPLRPLPATLVLLAFAPAAAGVTSDARSAPVALDQCFVEERADTPRFVVRGADVSLSLETGRMTWTIGPAAAVRVEPVAARDDVAPVGEARLPGVISRFHGPPDAWERALPTWRRVRYDQLWDGVDLALEADGQTVKATWRVAAGVDPGAVRLRHRGADAVSVDAEGRLVLETAAGSIVDAAPRAWQDDGDERRAVAVAFDLRAADDGAVDVGFALGAFDRARPLFIDPAVLVQAGFLGGTARDEAADVAVDAAGNVYVCGWARSTEASFPVVVGPSLHSNLASSPWGDAFVAKLDPTGKTLLYAGFIGGWDYDFAVGVAVDGLGRAYVAGHTASSPTELFPAVGGPDLTLGGSVDAWVARVSPSGAALEYCGYLGGTGFEDRALDVDVDASGRAYVAGHTDSNAASFPLKTGPGLVFKAGIEAWVARVAADGLSLDYCGYLAGDGFEEALAVKADGTGGAWLCGYTDSDQASFPVAAGPDLTYGGGIDGFVARVAPDGSHLVWCGYLGGDQVDLAFDLAPDPAGGVHVVGQTQSSAASLAPLVGPDLTPNGAVDGLVARVAPSGGGYTHVGYLGGGSDDRVYAVDVDAAGGAWLAGTTSSTAPGFPAANGPDDTANGGSDGFVARVLPSGAGLDFAGFVGGAGSDALLGIDLVPAAALPAGVTRAWVAGWSLSTETTFPVGTGPDVTANGQEDAVVAAVETGTTPWNDLGSALAGTAGLPVLTGAGSLVPNTPVTLALSNARASATAYLVLGVAAVNLPFNGGTLVPSPVAPTGLFVALQTSAAGAIVLPGTWPPGVPSGLSTYFQYWIVDPAGPAGYAASNALSGTAP